MKKVNVQIESISGEVLFELEKENKNNNDLKKKVLSKIDELNQLAGLSIELQYCNDYGGFYYLRDGENLAFGLEWLNYRMELKQLDTYLSGILDWYKFYNC